MDLSQTISETIKRGVGRSPSLALILGSGLGDFAGTLDDVVSVKTTSLEGYPATSVQGHAGRLVFGRINGTDGNRKDILMFQGRIHLYESGDLFKAVFPVLIAWKLGIRRLIITNAAGAMNPLFSAGDLMVIRDTINTTFKNPLRAIDLKGLCNNNFHHSYLSNVLIQKVISIALDLKIPLRQGLYCWVKGPSYETTAEIRMLRRMGGDVVGMSTVPEIMLASSLGMECVGISCITNMSTGLRQTKLSHKEVTSSADGIQEHFTTLLTALIRELS